ncbi:MAG: hypothetical protein GTO41_14895, partial [Burkholderiales bacterium]|nr:hypothetical protein [Burkholderiales bacterium]
MRAFKRLVVASFIAALALRVWAGAGDDEFERGYEAFVSRDYIEAMQWWQQAA